MPWLSRHTVLKVKSIWSLGCQKLKNQINIKQWTSPQSIFWWLPRKGTEQGNLEKEFSIQPEDVAIAFFLVTLQFLVVQPHLWKLVSSHRPLEPDIKFWDFITLLPQAHMLAILVWVIRKRTVHLVSIFWHGILQTGISMGFQAKKPPCVCACCKHITFWEVSAQLIHPM